MTDTDVTLTKNDLLIVWNHEIEWSQQFHAHFRNWSCHGCQETEQAETFTLFFSPHTYYGILLSPFGLYKGFFFFFFYIYCGCFLQYNSLAFWPPVCTIYDKYLIFTKSPFRPHFRGASKSSRYSIGITSPRLQLHLSCASSQHNPKCLTASAPRRITACPPCHYF